MRRFFAILLLLAGTLTAYFAISSLLWQHQAINHFIPVPATILDSHITPHRSKNSTSYSPDIIYSYFYAGQSFQSSQVLTYSFQGDRSWAQNIVARFPITLRPAFRPGPEANLPPPTAIAYINPQNPADSILIRQYSFQPYVFSLITCLAALIGLCLLTTDTFAKTPKMRALVMDDSDWRLLLPKQSLRARLRDASIWLAGTALFTIPLLADWFLHANQRSLGPAIVCLFPAVLLLFQTVAVIRRWSLTRHISDARLRIKPAPMVRGQPFALDLEADAYTPLTVQSAAATLTCIEHFKEKSGNKTTYGTRNKFQKRLDLAASAQISPGQILQTQADTLIESDQSPPTSNSTLYPYYTWEIRLTIALDHLPDYAATFPLECT